MAKQIRVSDDVYQMLLEIQRPRETFSELIARLLKMYQLLIAAEPIISGQHSYLEWKKEQLESEKTAHG